MALTVARSRHIRVPWMTIAVFVAAAIAAVAVLVLVNQPAQLTVESSPVTLTAPGAAVVPLPESQALLRTLSQAPPLATTGSAATVPRHNLVIGATLDPVSASAQPPAPGYRPGSVADPYPLNHFAGTP